MELSHIKLIAQSRACKIALREILHASFRMGKPADRVLSSFLRANKKYGSRDRQLITESIFATFRWWGAIRKILDQYDLSIIEHGTDADQKQFIVSEASESAILLAACLIDNNPALFDVASVWSKDLGLQPHVIQPRGKNTVNDIVESIRSVLYQNRTVPKLPEVLMKDMFPEWVLPYFPAGIDINELALLFQKRPPMWIRAQTSDPDDLFKRLKTYGFAVKRHEKLKNSICIENARINLYTVEEFKKGLFEIQDLASQVIGLVCNPVEKQRWWDACAGAGGKTLQLADMMNRKGTVTATDIREYKLDDLRIRARRAGFPNIMCAEWNGKALRKKKQGCYDGVLVDSPCSCSGTWRRNPDARWTMQPSELQEMPELQFQILSNASSGVKVGGVLVYATCSFFKEENSDVVTKFLETNKNFELEPFINPLNGIQTPGMLQVYPWDGNCDAMFVARFIRKS